MEERKCKVCGCTDKDCRQCIEKTGAPCHWVAEDLCSACMNKGDQFIETRGAEDHGMRVKFRDNTSIYIGRFDTDFFNQLRELPAYKKIQLMDVSDLEVIDYIYSRRKEMTDELLICFSIKWYWKETGQEVKFNDRDLNDEYFEYPYPKAYINKKLRSNSVATEDLVRMLYFFKESDEVLPF